MVLAGLSLKTQYLYAIVFTCRYLDLFTNFYSMYNTVLKVGQPPSLTRCA